MNESKPKRVADPAFQARVKAWRTSRGLSWTEAGYLAGVDACTWYRWEKYGRPPRGKNDREKLERVLAGESGVAR